MVRILFLCHVFPEKSHNLVWLGSSATSTAADSLVIDVSVFLNDAVESL